MNSGGPTPTVTGSLETLTIKPSDTAACISTYNLAHYVYLDTSVTANGRLFLFLPGTGSDPSQVPALLKEGALRGYHVIGLEYPNQDAVNSLCNSAGNTDLDCFGNIRKEIITGQDLSSLVSVDPQNSIEGRLKSLLEYLIATRSGEGWDNYFVAGLIQWNLISVGGHSQGGGHAALIGKLHSVYRVSMYSSPSDYNVAVGQAANWFSMAGQTNASKYFGFIQSNDTIANFSGNPNQVSDAWGNASYFNMGGALTDVDGASAPYSNSQRLYSTTYSSLSASSVHSSTLVSGYQAVWDYISFP
jgi:hypothetical protein